MSKNVQIIKDIGAKILDLRYIYKTDKVISQNADSALSKWNEYIDYYNMITDYFSSTNISQNPFLNKTDLRTFYQKYLSFIDKSADYALEMTKNEIIVGEETILEKYQNISSEYLTQIENKKTDFEGLQPLLIEFQEIVKKKDIDLKEYHEINREGLDKPFYFYLHSFLDRFHSILAKCESPLEEAFFIGLIAYEPFYDFWIFEEKFDNQVKVQNYRLDFAFIDRDKDIFLDIELDGHSFHERTEEQAVRDRQRNIELQEEGWFVLRFHRKEIEDDLRGCIERIKKFYEMKSEQRSQIN